MNAEYYEDEWNESTGYTGSENCDIGLWCARVLAEGVVQAGDVGDHEGRTASASTPPSSCTWG